MEDSECDRLGRHQLGPLFLVSRDACVDEHGGWEADDSGNVPAQVVRRAI